MLTDKDIRRIVAKANLAPSVHNTQPARWRFEGDGSIVLAADMSRFLPAGDPTFRDAGLSCGAALEGTVLALADSGFSIGKIEDYWRFNDCTTIPGQRMAARIYLINQGVGEAVRDPLGNEVQNRFTWRSHFLNVEQTVTQNLGKWASEKSDVTLLTEKTDIDFLACANDSASLVFMRDKAFRHELFSWMRLSKSDPLYQADGLNLDALKMSVIEGFGAKFALGGNRFDLLDKIGVAKLLVGEGDKTRSSSAIALFHRPSDESPIETGRAFYRFWLEMTQLGFSAWPMASVADNPNSAGDCCKRFSIPKDHRLINVLRVGRPGKNRPQTARLNSSDLIV